VSQAAAMPVGKQKLKILNNHFVLARKMIHPFRENEKKCQWKRLAHPARPTD
jgi:hypothetical protein